MQTQQTQVRNHRPGGKRLLLTAGICFAAVLILTTAVLSVDVLASHKIHAGVYINQTYVGNMTKEAAAEQLSGLWNPESTIQIRCGDVEKSFTLAEVGTEFSVDESVEAAYTVGRTGNLFRRIGDYLDAKMHERHIAMQVHCDEELLTTYIEEIAGKCDEPQQEREIVLEGEAIQVSPGHSGRRINLDHAKQSIYETMGTVGSGEVELVLETVDPKPIDAQSIYDEVCGEPVDATYEVKNYKLEIIPEKVGIQFDISEAERLIRESGGGQVTIPVKVTQPNVNAETLRASMFPDQLGTFSTRFNAGDRNRSYNIALASKFINGTVLAPGDVFSYNDVVGPRTAARGFKDAGVYVGNKVEQGIGGGICQVSSTLFNSAVLSDLNIVYRTNHSMPVSYVGRGRDATVSYGSIDFKFSNNTNAPIKIVASGEGGVCAITIYGVKADQSKTIEFAVTQTGTTPMTVKQKDDPELPEGTTKIEQKGQDGTAYNTYKITKRNGAEVSRELLTRSNYIMVEQIELVGTKKSEESQETTPPAGEEKSPVETQAPAEAAETPKPDKKTPVPVPAAGAEDTED